MYKAYHYMLPDNIQRNFVKKDVNHRTRSKQQLVRSCVSSNALELQLQNIVKHYKNSHSSNNTADKD